MKHKPKLKKRSIELCKSDVTIINLTVKIVQFIFCTVYGLFVTFKLFHFSPHENIFRFTRFSKVISMGQNE